MKRKLISLVLTLAIIALSSVPVFATDISSADTSLTLDSTKLALGVGDSTTLTASVMGCIMSDAVWTSGDESVATVSGGTVTALKLGRTVITATTSDGQSASCNVHVALKGIDVSSWQKSISWSDVKSAGINFAIIRTGYGHEQWDKQTDAYFNANYDGATANGIKVGVYHYSYATSVEAALQEAKMCLSILNGRHLDYPVFIDVEDQCQRVLSRELLCSIVETFCSEIERNGYKAGIYSSPNIYNSNLANLDPNSYERWVAHWGVDAARYSSPYTMWQYGSGSIPGISGAVDLDYSYQDYSSIDQSITNPGNTSPSTPAGVSLVCDTMPSYSFGSNNVYYYKITTASTTVPTAVSSNTSSVTVTYSKKLSDGYLYKITNISSGSSLITTSVGNSSVSFTAYGKANGVISDTTSPFTMKRGATYQFKFTPTGTSATPKFTTGNGSVITPVLLKKIGSSYYYKVSGVGRGCTGVYSTLPGQQPVRQCIVTVV